MAKKGPNGEPVITRPSKLISIRYFVCIPKDRQGEVQPDAIAKIEKEEAKKAEKKAGFHERDLHPLLTYFAYSNLPFNRGRAVHTKTIYHENAKKPGYNEWVYPDMVGLIGVVHLDLDDIDASEVVFPARRRDGLDWDTINKLCEQSDDFKKFLKHVTIDFQAKTLHKSEYDDVLKDVPEYIKLQLMAGSETAR